MTNFESSVRTTADRLAALGVDHALVGGLAVSVRCEPRFTRDVDLVAAVASDNAAEGVVRELVRQGYRVLATVEQEAVGRLATVRLRHGEDEVVDLLFASSGIEREVTRAAELLEVLPSLVLPVAVVGHLIALKLLSADERTRPQDAVDLRALLAVSGPADLDVAREAVGLIEARGYGRGRNLSAALDGLHPVEAPQRSKDGHRPNGL